jgi:hypothetical protein
LNARERFVGSKKHSFQDISMSIGQTGFWRTLRTNKCVPTNFSYWSASPAIVPMHLVTPQ